MNDNEAIMIGGVCDGTVCPVDAPNRTGARTALELHEVTAPYTPVTLEKSHYRLEWFRSGSRKFAIYIEIGMSHDEAMERLIERYVR